MSVPATPPRPPIWSVLVLGLGILGAICYSYLGVVWGGLILVSAAAVGMEIFLCWILGWRSRRTRAGVEVLVILAIGGVLFDYKPPTWWKELWTQGGQAKESPDNPALKETADDPAFLTIKSDDRNLWVSIIGENIYYEPGNAQPLEVWLQAGRYTLRVKKQGQLVYEEQLILAKGEKQE